ncbi:hypothetical protein ACOYR1_02080 [Thalassotalea piscium]
MYKLINTMIVILMLSPTCVFAQEIDPTSPLFGSEVNLNQKSNQAIQLQSIVGQGKQATVVINGKVLRLGGLIEQYQLAKINKNSVVLASTSTDKRLELSLFSPVVAESK